MSVGSLGRSKGSILHNLHYNYGFGEAWMERQYYNANYVTYRGLVSRENTEDFEARKNWIFGAWNQSKGYILCAYNGMPTAYISKK